MSWFSDCKTKEDAKTLYRKLAKLFHPDHSGDQSLMVELQKQYDSYATHDQPQRNEYNMFAQRRPTPFRDNRFDNENLALAGRILQLEQELHNAESKIRHFEVHCKEHFRCFTEVVNELNHKKLLVDSLNQQLDHLRQELQKNEIIIMQLNEYINSLNKPMSLWEWLKGFCA